MRSVVCIWDVPLWTGRNTCDHDSVEQTWGWRWLRAIWFGCCWGVVVGCSSHRLWSWLACCSLVLVLMAWDSVPFVRGCTLESIVASNEATTFLRISICTNKKNNVINIYYNRTVYHTSFCEIFFGAGPVMIMSHVSMLCSVLFSVITAWFSSCWLFNRLLTTCCSLLFSMSCRNFCAKR